ncbi:NmrA-like family protein [Exophiala viscosa]|uniref:NmrA-like family protein n=1 Tax=Exophiala viscosa TaxID=2486360 RepID=A0AAN6DY21_9EURO|nr:NmrA-like family protein [Exophiala viscosa]KAI1624379.1 NmrA-like family protein [Exophiala viscosa]
MSQVKSQLPTRAKSILVIGAGELGTAIIQALTSHALYSPSSTKITLMVRPSSLTNPSPEKVQQHTTLRNQGINLVGADIEASTQDELSNLFRPYTAIMHAGGMTSQPGTMLKVTQAVLSAEVEYYIPWQHGVNYDAITRRGGQGMFAEQIDVRDLLRSQTATQWTIISCGIFMSFLFEEYWGVVVPLADGEVQVTALNSWDDMITTTTAEDIGRVTAGLVFDGTAPVNQPVYIAGDTLSYGQFADVVRRATGRQVVRRVWPVEFLRDESRMDPGDKLKRYRVVFAEGVGLSWPLESTWSARKGMRMVTVEEYVRDKFRWRCDTVGGRRGNNGE